MKLNKRDCSISIELVPCGADLLKVVWHIGGRRHLFWVSSAMGYQFSSFVGAVYQLYSEETDPHHRNRNTGHKGRIYYPGSDSSLLEDEVRVSTYVHWDGECGRLYGITFSRICKNWNYPVSDGDDVVTINLGDEFTYTVDGRDLCYAVAKAYTDAIKQYGFYGYYSSTGGNCNGFGDIIDLHMILFIKAYALGGMEVRKLTTTWVDRENCDHAESSPFEKEIELLLFDM